MGLRLGTLYAINLFGAVAGSFLAGFVFLPLLGVRATNIIAARFNLTLAAAVLLARGASPGADEAVASPRAPGHGAPWKPSWRPRRCRRRPWSPAPRRAVLAGVRRLGRDRDDPAGAVDPRRWRWCSARRSSRSR